MRPGTVFTGSGIVEAVKFQNPDTGFHVLTVAPDTGEPAFDVVGESLPIDKYDHVCLEGRWAKGKFGPQIKASNLHVSIAETAEQIRVFLRSGVIKGVGPATADKIVDMWGSESLNVMAKTPSSLAEVKGISKRKAQDIGEAWLKYKREKGDTYKALMFLQQKGLTPSQAQSAINLLEDDVIAKVKHSPYILLGVTGLGFKRVDQIAQAIGIEQDNVERIEAALNHVMVTHGLKEGHSGLPREKIQDLAEKLLHGSAELIRSGIDAQIDAGKLIVGSSPYGECLFERAAFITEQAIAKEIRRLQNGNPVWKRVTRFETHMDGYKLSEKQVDAQQMVARNKTSIIIGLPGSGKTTVLKSVISTIKRRGNPSIGLCAPSGKAAQRAFEATGVESSTIQRLLKVDSVVNGKFKYIHNAKNPLSLDLVILDEAGMADAENVLSLLQALPDTCSVVFVGDTAQLFSIGFGAVLRDLIASNEVEKTELDRPQRVGADSGIHRNAELIRKGELIEFEYVPGVSSKDFLFIECSGDQAQQKIMKLLTKSLPKRGYDPIKDVYVLSPMKKGEVGVNKLNTLMQSTLNPSHKYVTSGDRKFALNDKVIQKENDSDRGISNGDVGFITELDQEASTITVTYGTRRVEYKKSQLGEIECAFTTSVHKSQGSEAPVVIMPMVSEHSRMLNRNLFYTGVTRGKKLVIIVGEKKAVAKAVTNTVPADRYTSLEHALKHPELPTPFAEQTKPVEARFQKPVSRPMKKATKGKARNFFGEQSLMSHITGLSLFA